MSIALFPASRAETPESNIKEDALKTLDVARGDSVPSESENDQEFEAEKGNELHTTISRKSKAEEIYDEIRKEAVKQEEKDIEYPSSLKLAMINTALCLAVLCVALDNTIIATAIPKITDQFHSLSDVGWYASAYLLTCCAFQLFFGKLYTFFNIKWVYLCALAVFEIGSAVCGAAPSSPALIVGRAVAGLGAAGLFSGSLLILANSVPLKKRPIYTGLIGGMYGIASVVGPLLGGVFTDKLTWRWCFYINLPLGAVTGLFILFFFSSPPPTEAARSLAWKDKLRLLDLEGTAVFVPGIVCVLLALQWGGSKYDWSNWRIILCFIMFGVLITIFIGIQFWKHDLATIPPRIISQRTVLSSSAFIACLGGSFFAIIYYVPIWFQAIKGATAEHSGIMNIPLVLSVTIFSIVGGIGTTVTGYYTPWIILAPILMSIGAGLMSTWQVDTGHAMWIGYQVIYGAGVGAGIQSPMIAVQAVLPMADVPTGTAIIVFFQTFGGALFVSVAENIFENQLLTNLKALVPEFPAETVLDAGATSLASAVPAQYLPAVLQAYNISLAHTFYVATALACLAIVGAVFVEWISVKGKKIEAAAA